MRNTGRYGGGGRGFGVLSIVGMLCGTAKQLANHRKQRSQQQQVCRCHDYPLGVSAAFVLHLLAVSSFVDRGDAGVIVNLRGHNIGNVLIEQWG